MIPKSEWVLMSSGLIAGTAEVGVADIEFRKGPVSGMQGPVGAAIAAPENRIAAAPSAVVAVWTCVEYLVLTK